MRVFTIKKLLIFFFIVSSCKKNTFTNITPEIKRKEFYKNTITLDTIKIYKDSTRLFCGSGVYISEKIEKNKKTAEILKKYISLCLLESDYCKQIDFSSLFQKPSFEKAIIYIYTSKYFLKSNIYEDETRWKENYINLLANCVDKKALVSLSDELLKLGIDDGIVVLFNKEKVHLKYLSNYIVCNSDNFYKLSMLALYFKNTSNEKSLNETMAYINKIDKKKYDQSAKTALLELLKKTGKVEYEDYVQSIIGGY